MWHIIVKTKYSDLDFYLISTSTLAEVHRVVFDLLASLTMEEQHNFTVKVNKSV